MARLPDGRLENFYAVWCPCCHKTLCTQCLRYEGRIQLETSEPGGERRYIQGVQSKWRKHLREYDHEYVDGLPPDWRTWAGVAPAPEPALAVSASREG